MSEKIKIEKLAPMRVASFYGFGDQPESIAWTKLEEWARKKGTWQDFERQPVFGFNNPDPTPASPNYGYEVWAHLSEDDLVDESIPVKAFSGGLYAVLRCPVPRGQYDVIGQTWRKLVAWREKSRYAHGTHQWLEKSVRNEDPKLEFVLDLYLPIRETD